METPWRFIADKYGYRGCWSFPIKRWTVKPLALSHCILKQGNRREDVDLADVITKAAAVISPVILMQRAGRMEAALQKAKKIPLKLEQEIKDRTAEVVAGKQLLQTTMDASLDQVFEYETGRRDHRFSLAA